MKKQIYVIISILIMLLLVGCSADKAIEPTQKETTPKVTVETRTETTPTVKVETKEEVIETKPEPEPAVKVAPTQKLPAAVQELLTKAETKTKSCQYLLSEPPENRFLNTYFVKGDKIKVKIFEGNAYKIGEYYDTVYLDTAAKTATARCENDRRCTLGGADNTRNVFEANYDAFITKTPSEWLKVVTNAEVIGPEVVDSRSATKIKTIQSGKIIELWLHNTYGIPLKVRVVQSGMPDEVYQFTDSTCNHLKDSDVMPKFTTTQY